MFSVIRSAVERSAGPWASLNTVKLFCLLLLSAAAACANVCTPVNYPADGPFQAIVNGIDAVDWGVARIQWTSDASSSVPATLQRIQYATAAEWAANPGVYPHTQGLQAITITSPTIFQGAQLPNLLPSTTYHVLGQSYQGGAWCSAPDETLTTLPYTPPAAKLPQQFDTTQPTVTGHDYTYGVDCGTTGNDTARFQDCLNQAQPGDGVGIPPGTYSISRLYPSLYPDAVALSGSAVSGSTITNNGHGLSNGQQIRFSSQYGYPPSPINIGVTYKVINATTNTFQVSYDGVTPLTFKNAGSGQIYYVKWPLAGKYIVFHSTAPASALPPPGVRLDPTAYAASLPVVEANDPTGPLFNWAPFDSYYWFQNIEFSIDPNIGADAQGNTGVDPVGFVVWWATSSDQSNIVWNQSAFVAPPPRRTRLMNVDGTNIGFLNSYIQGLDFWQPFRAIGAPSITNHSLTIPAGSYYWVGSGGPIGTKKTCTTNGGTLNFSGSGSGSFYIYMDPATCALDAQVSNTMTASGQNVSVLSVASPAYPTYSWTAPIGSVIVNYSDLLIGNGSVNGGTVTGYSDSLGQDIGVPESGDGLSMNGGPGPLMVVNNFIQCTGVCGTFLTDGITDGGSVCGNTNPCPMQYNQGDLTEQRNTVNTNPCFMSNSSCWNGGNYYWRDVSEVKQGKNVLKDGNIYGPYSAQVAGGGCPSQLQFQAGFPIDNGYPSYLDSSNLTYTNNTCYQIPAGVGTIGEAYQPITPAFPQKNIILRNNLFYQVNSYTAVSPLAPYGAVHTQTGASCTAGGIFTSGGSGQGYVFDHNTIYQLGGCQPLFFEAFLTLSSGVQLTNNIFNVVGWGSYDPAYTGMRYVNNAGTGSGTLDVPDCAGSGGSILMGCLSQSTWAGNVVLASWTNSFPGSLTEYTNAQIATLATLFPAKTYVPSAGTTLADRINQIGWFAPDLQNMRLKPTSPYISGAHVTPDGLDVGVNMDALEAAQGKVSNVRAYGTSNTSTKIGFLAPDAFGCSVDWGTSDFSTGVGAYTRVTNAGGQRAQNVTLTALPAHSRIYYRVNCAVQQPLQSVQLP